MRTLGLVLACGFAFASACTLSEKEEGDATGGRSSESTGGKASEEAGAGPMAGSGGEATAATGGATESVAGSGPGSSGAGGTSEPITTGGAGGEATGEGGALSEPGAGAGGQGPTAECVEQTPAWEDARARGDDVYDSAFAVAVSPCGEILLGTESHSGNGMGQRGALIQLGLDGEPTWRRELPVEEGERALVRDLVVNASGTVSFVAGLSRDSATLLLVGQYTASGELSWSTRLAATTSASPVAIGEDARGNLVIAGSAAGQLPHELPEGAGNGFIAKLSSDGEHLWTARVQGSGAGVDPAGNTYVTVAGQDPAADGFLNGAVLSKRDPQGELLWTKPIGLPPSFENPEGYDWHDPAAVAVSADGTTVYAAAQLGTSDCQRMCPYHSVITRFTSDGERGDSFFPSGDEDLYGFGIQELAANATGSSVYVLGLLSSLSRYDAPAGSEWVFPGSADSGGFYTSAFALDRAGNPYLVGSATVDVPTVDNQTDWVVIPVDGETGIPR